ncbi:unnamed protein product [Caenorhabditis auriculariae]|uniref:Protein OSCP1 n=1 Tax=Caenorhabditis auriculariae TaxID=2777116 RepID=A0A8S1H406_9PELO|nr:unnamed protein product [Caenorhabditis auriculariae]
MSDRLLPVLYINMAGEMMYILEQRLRNIDDEKSGRVLKEILLAVLNKTNLEEIFKARGLPSKRSLKMLYERLAHSSIMRLNENSMDKLFDLMTMTTKFELQQIVMAEQVMTVTVNHLQGIMDTCPNDEEVKQLVEHAYTMIFSLYRNLSPFSWHMIRCGLLSYFQDAHVKISMLLRENRQMSSGHFYLFPDSEPIVLPKDGEPVGATKYYENGTVNTTNEIPTEYTYMLFEPKPDGLNVEQRSTTLGANMYKDASSLKIQGAGGTAKSEEEREGNELKLLESMFGDLAPSASSGNRAKKHSGELDLSMFDDAGEEMSYVKETEAVLGNVLTIDATRNKTIDTAMQEMKLERAPSAKKKTKSKGADMLDMLDEAAARPPTAKPKKATAPSGTRSRATSESRARSASKPNTAERAPSAGNRRKSSGVKKE